MRRRGLLANAGYKVASLIMAGFVWFHVTEHQLFEQVVGVPLRIVNLPRNLAVVSELPAEVKLRVRAQGRLMSLRNRGITVPVDLSDVRPGRVTRLLSPADVEIPQGVRAEVTRVLSPGGLILECDSVIIRDVTVVPSLQGAPASGFMQSRAPTVTPREVRLRGPERQVRNVISASTEPVDLDNAREDVLAEPPIALRGMRGVEATPARVSVNIPIEKVESFELSEVPVIVQGADDTRTVTWEPRTVRVELRGARSRFEAWNASSIALTIDARDLPPGHYEFLAESGGGRLVKLVPLAEDMRSIPRGVEAASGTQGIRALLSLPEFLEVASVTPRAFHLMVR